MRKISDSELISELRAFGLESSPPFPETFAALGMVLKSQSWDLASAAANRIEELIRACDYRDANLKDNAVRIAALERALREAKGEEEWLDLTTYASESTGR